MQYRDEYDYGEGDPDDLGCAECGNPYSKYRRALGYMTCKMCGEAAAKKVKHCVVPMHKSNLVVVTDRALLKGIGNKGGLHSGEASET